MKGHFQTIVNSRRNVVCTIECIQWIFIELFQWNFSDSYWKYKGKYLWIIKCESYFYFVIFIIWLFHFKLFDDAASFLGLIGMLIGAGNVISGAVFVFGATWINKLNRTVLLSMLVIENTWWSLNSVRPSQNVI